MQTVQVAIRAAVTRLLVLMVLPIAVSALVAYVNACEPRESDYCPPDVPAAECTEQH
jgi:hypothetical protein